jgi:hypothetical protein|tara:strand:+ start:1100 stop:1474 length:375 start_codon:yes stop_codon:yes gene_type:complete
MKISTGAYMKASQLSETGETRTILSCKQEPIRDGSGKEELRWILYLDGGLKPLILNSTNIKTLVAQHGEETDDWPGLHIVVFQDASISYGGVVTGGVRLRAVKAKARRNAKAEEARLDAEDIPF